jgi:hypothetical protein
LLECFQSTHDGQEFQTIAVDSVLDVGRCKSLAFAGRL